MARKRVLIFSLQYFPYVGGAEVALKELTDRLSDIEFHMVTLRFDSALPKVEQIGNVLVHRIGFVTKAPSIKDLRRFPLHLNKHLYQILAAFVAKKLHAQYSYDAVWAMMAHATGIPAGLFKKAHPDVPYLLTLQEGDPTDEIERTMRPAGGLFTQAFVLADELQAISTFLLSWGKRMGFKGEGVIIPNGVDTKRFEHSARRTGEGVSLVTTSRLVKKNALDDVIKALPLLPEVHFALYGVGPEEELLKSLAQELGVSDRVSFKGQVDQAELPTILAEHDIFIRPSRSEGMGNSFIEAMAAGLPVIATQEGGIADFLFDAKRNPDVPATGWAVDVGSPQQIAEAVQQIRANPEEVKRTVENARAMAQAGYDWGDIAKKMESLFSRLFEGRVK